MPRADLPPAHLLLLDSAEFIGDSETPPGGVSPTDEAGAKGENTKRYGGVL